MKMHLRANKEKEGLLNTARCAAVFFGNGQIVKNNRETYRNIPQDRIVGLREFADVPEEDRCMHCMDMGLLARNRQRRKKGLPPINSLFEAMG